MKVYLIRHGQTDANKNKIVQGQTDNPLNTQGIRQAKKTGLYLKKQGIKFDYCITSPLSRAIDTANIIKNILHIDLENHIEPRIIERDFGALDGKKIQDNYYERVHQALVENIETDQMIEDRVRLYFNDLFENHHKDNILMVAHSHVIKALLVQYQPGFAYDTYLNNCSINILSYKDKRIRIDAYNINPLD